jgi:universal stress protein E
VTNFSRILCVVDPTQDEQPALGRARWFAKHSGAAIDLQVCYYDEYLSGHRFSDSDSLSKARAAVLDKQQEKLDALAKPLRDEGLSVSTTVTWDHPLDEGIVRQSRALRAEIVFKDIHYHSPLSRALFTHTDWALIRTCPVPLWLVSPHDIVDPTNTIAAIDPFNVHDKPAALDKQLLDVGQIVATHTNGTLHAFHCFDPRGITAAAAINTYTPMPMAMPDLERELLEHHQNRFSEITEHHGIPKDQSHLAVGSVRDELPALATKLNAALVVMGAISRNTMERLFIGATAEQTLGRLPCDLLVIKPVDSTITDIA